MGWLSIASVLSRLALTILESYQDHKTTSRIRAAAAAEALREAQELIEHARRIDQDTASLPLSTRERVRRATRRAAGQRR